MENRRLVLVIIVGITIFGIGVVVWWGKRQVPVEPLPQLPAVEITPAVPQPGVPSYTLRAPLPQIEKLPVYQYAPLDFARGAEALLLHWSKTLGFSGEPEVLEDALEGTLYLWPKEGQTLVINEDVSSLAYRADLNEPAALSGSFLPTFEQAAEIVERTLTELGSARGGSGDSNLLAHDPTKNKSLKTGVSLVQETKLSEAELVEVHFVAKVDTHPLYLESGPEWDPVLAWIGRDGKLLRLEYRPLGTVGEKIADYPLKNSEEVLQNLDNGKGVVVSSNLSGGERIVSTTITRVSLGYLLPSPEANVIQPVFVLKGNARTAQGKVGQVIIYLEAVSGTNF